METNFVTMIPWAPSLTVRELQILGLVALGYSAKEVAHQCGIAYRTVQAQLDTMRLKLRARNTTHLVAVALASDLLPKAEGLLEVLATSPEPDSDEPAVGLAAETGQAAAPDLGSDGQSKPKRPGWFLRLD